VRHNFTKQEAKTLRESKVPILVHVALHDKLMKPEQQQALARMLNANTLVIESGRMLGLDLRSTFQNECEKLIDEASQ
jgi:homoserine acetyltransferase